MAPMTSMVCGGLKLGAYWFAQAKELAHSLLMALCHQNFETVPTGTGISPSVQLAKYADEW